MKTLTELAQGVISKFNEEKEIVKRLDFAAELAKRYKFNPKEIVLFYTHPTLSKLPFKERCEKFGFTEEQIVLYAAQPGVKKFLRDLEELAIGTLRSQSFEKLSTNIARQRYRYDKMGNEIEDFSIELEILKGSAPEKSAPTGTVNVQFNMWEQARARAKEIGKVIEVASEDE